MVQRGWFFVIVGLLISSFLGGAVRVFFSPERVRVIVETLLEERQPKFEIQFKSAKLQLADSWWPTLAIELNGLDVKAKDECITNSAIQVDSIVVPFQLSTLFAKKKKFGHVRAGEVRLFMRPSSCKTRIEVSEPVDGFAPFERFFQKRWSKEVVNTTRYLDVFSVGSLELLRDNQGLAPAIIKDLEMRFLPDRGESEVSFLIQLGQPWVGEADFGAIKVFATIRSDSVTVRGEGNLKEGQIQIESEWAVDRSDLVLNVFSQDLPAQSVLAIAQHWGLMRGLQPNMKNQWLTCDMSLHGAIREFYSLPVNLHQCRLYGDLGEMDIKTTQIKNLKEGGELNVQIQELDVRKILSNLGLKNNWGYLSHLGQFTGEIKFIDSANYVLSGDVRDAEIYVVNQSGQVKQKINRFIVDLLFKNNLFTGEFNKFLIDEGRIGGAVKFELNTESSGRFYLNFDHLELPVVLQKILWDGVVKQGRVNAEGKIESSRLLEMKSTIQASDFQTQQWLFENLKVNTHYANDIWLLQLQADKFMLKPESRYQPLMGAIYTFIDEKVREKISEVALYKVSGEYKIEGIKPILPVSDDVSGGEPAEPEITIRKGSIYNWDKVKALAPDQKTTLRARGSWSKGEDLDGQIVALGSNKKTVWVVYGNTNAPQIKAVAVE